MMKFLAVASYHYRRDDVSIFAKPFDAGAADILKYIKAVAPPPGAIVKPLPGSEFALGIAMRGREISLSNNRQKMPPCNTRHRIK